MKTVSPFPEPVAVIGAACRFPGGAVNLDSFWQLLASGTDAVTRLPADRFSQERYISASRTLEGHCYTPAAGIIQNLKEFDPEFFGISRKEAQDMDPQQRLALETTWEALECAFLLPSSLRGSGTGVYFGASNMDHSMRCPDDPCISTPYAMTGSTLSIIANRVSYIFDWHGPSLIVDTACSSSLAAIHLACEDLRSGAVPLAVAGGINVLLMPYPFIGFAKARMLSPDGRCKVFDASGNGYVRSEGAGVVLLKRLSEAEADGDPILGVIAASGVNSDGRTTGIALPNKQAQRALLRQVYERFNLDKRKLVYVEAHGTGTAAGDPIEAAAIGSELGLAVRQSGPLPVGSVKSNIGHLEPASGIAGLIKALLVLRHNAVPPNLHLTTPHPDIDFAALNITVPTSLTPLREAGGGELISVNSFGFGGTNAHIVLQRPTGRAVSDDCPPERGLPLPPLLLSAKSGPSLCALAEAYARLLEKADPAHCYDVAATLAKERECMPLRTVVIGGTPAELRAQLRKTAKNGALLNQAPLAHRNGAAAGGVFVFSGNGSQWRGMGKALLEENRDFRAAVEEVNDLLLPLQGWSILEVLRDPDAHEEAYTLTEKNQPLLFAMQAGIVAALRARGILPSAVIGHSVGEVAAAWACGALSLPDATRVIYFRSTLQGVLRGVGAMGVVSLSEQQALPLLNKFDGRVEIAAVNTVSSLTVAGPEADLRHFMDLCKQRRITAKMLNIPYPFHTRAMETVRERLLEALADIAPTRPVLPFFSTTTGGLAAGLTDNRYWYENIRRPVLFAKGIHAAAERGYRLFLEIGPSPVLRSYIRDTFRQNADEVFISPTLLQGKNEAADLEAAWKTAWQNGWPLDAAVLFPHRHQRRELPAYPWNRELLWAASTPECRDFLFAGRAHPLLGWPLPGNAPVFENTLLPADFPWLADHMAGNGIVYPAAAFLESMLAAAARVHPGADQLELERVGIFRALPLSDNSPKVVRISVDREDGGLLVEARPHMSGEAWGVCARGRIIKDAATPPEPEQPFGNPENFGLCVEQERLYKTAERFLLHYGPAFRTVERAWVKSDPLCPEVLVELGDPVPASAEGMFIPPTLLDGALQSLFLLLGAQMLGAHHAYLPVAFEHVVLYASGRPRYAHARLERVSPRSVLASFRLLDGTGKRLLLLRNCRFRRAAWLEHESAPSEPYTVELTPAPHPEDLSPLEGVSTAALAGEVGEALQTAATSVGNETSQSVHPYLLLQYAALSAAHESVLSLCGDKYGAALPCSTDLVDSRDLAPAQEAWFNHMLERLENSGLALRNGQRRTILPRGERPKAATLWRTIVSSASGYLPEATLLADVFHRHRDILSGACAENEILPAGLTDAYFAASPVLQPFARAACQAVRAVLDAGRPGQTMQVLQIARQPSALLPDVLPLLRDRNCRYVVAEKDDSAAEALALQYGTVPSLVFAALDPENPKPAHQERYHLILLAWSLYQHLDSARVLEGCRAMLAPGGMLCLLEHTPTLFADYVFGAQPAWWAASASAILPVSLLRDMDHWQNALEQAGFIEIEAAAAREEEFRPAFLLLARKGAAPLAADAAAAAEIASVAEAGASPDANAKTEARQPCGNAVATEGTEAEKQPPARWLLVAGEEGSDSALLGQALQAELRSRVSQPCTLLLADNDLEGSPFAPEDSLSWQSAFSMHMQQSRKGGVHIVYLAGYDTREELPVEELAALQNRAASGLAALARAWDQLRPEARLFVLSGGALADGMPDARPVPSQGVVAGFCRVLMNEMRSLAPRSLDLHGDLAAALAAVPLLARDLLRPDGEPEVVLCRGLRFAPRVTSLMPRNRREEDDAGATLAFDQPGRLQNLYWKTMPVPVPQEDEVCVEVRYTGLNFRDVMWSMGMLLDEALENGFSGPSMGIECSGVICAVGSAVKDWKIGDAVVCFTPGGFSSHVLTRASALARKPANVTFAEAATIPVAFFTAWYSLKHLARLQPGERVLIHGAAGGVGLAAIQIAAHLGLEVYATAGSREKHSFLRQMGVRHIFSSRSLAFARQVMEATGGQGVDAVLNSLAGEAIPAGLSVLRPFGRFLELGKRDFYADTPMRLRPFSNNLSYFGVDVDQLLIHQPALGAELFAELMRLFELRRLAPLPHTVLPVTKTVQAFRTMQKSAHIGKLVVAMDGAPAIARPPAVALRKARLRDEATYLVTGGAGGFGLASAARLARRGARHLLLLSRSGVKDAGAEKIIADMRAGGVSVTLAKCDVADAGKLRQCLKQTLKTMPPLRGVIHAAAALDDGLASGLTPERIAASLAAKTLGAWNLHEYTRSLPLDFFVLYSSATTPFGNPGQAGYVAANCMLEALGAYRKARRLPAEVVGWGAIADTGMLTRNPKARDMLLKVLGISPTPSAEALYWLEHVIHDNISSSHYFGLDWQSRADLPALSRPRFSRLRLRQTTAQGTEGPSLEYIRSLDPKAGVACIAGVLLDEIAHVLRLPKDRLTPGTPLAGQGMDSLMAVELALAIEQRFELTGYTLPLSEKTTALSLAESLYAMVCGGAGAETAQTGTEEQLLRSMEQKHGFQLSEEKRDALLQQITEDEHE